MGSIFSCNSPSGPLVWNKCRNDRKKCRISDDGLSATGHNCAVIGSKAADMYTVKIQYPGIISLNKSAGLKVGFSTGSSWSSSGSNEGFFITLHDNSMFGVTISGQNETRLGDFFSGDLLTVIKDGNDIVFQRNKVPIKDALVFPFIKFDQPLYPAVDIPSHDATVTLLKEETATSGYSNLD